MRMLFLGKRDDSHCKRALDFALRHFEVQPHLGAWGDSLPLSAFRWEGEYIVSYLSRWVVPIEILNHSRFPINFHPGPPEYPGIGCNNFALYDDAKTYGVTCHYMSSKVDTGAIIALKRFPVYDNDDVESLLERSYDYQLVMYYEIMGDILSTKPLPRSSEKWMRKPYTRQEFEKLFVVTPEMSQDERRKRIRAVTYKGWHVMEDK